MTVEYRLLGPVEALIDGRPARLGGPRQRGVLVVLLTHANRVVTANRVIDELWEDDPPASATNLVQGYVSGLRKALGKDAIETRGAGYLLRAGPGALDLHRFEQSADAGGRALGDGRPAEAAELLARALAEWRGAALADLDGEPFLEPVAARLEELRMLAEERRLEAVLASGGHADALAGIDVLVRAHPLRELPRRLQMLALYRSGRQAEALAAYRAARGALVEELGIEPSPALQELERAILRHDPAIGGPRADGVGARDEEGMRAILVTALSGEPPAGLLAQAAELARAPAREVIVVRTVAGGGELAAATEALNDARRTLLASGVPARVACFTSLTPGADLARMAGEHDVDLLLVDAPAGLLEDAQILALLAGAPCDVGVVVEAPPRPGAVLVPFAGAEHDWSAVELGAWLARNREVALRLVGASTGEEGRDASRLLASASLAVQRTLGVPADPVLVTPTPDALVEAARDAGVVVVGLTDRWRRDGLGPARTALATRSGAPAILVRRGSRPGGLAPREAHTRFTWTIVA
jgi:DNA-binding SARP family transcriptional activator